MRLHNRTRGAHYVAFCTVAPHCRLVESADNVLLEPTGLSRCFLRKRPADVALRLVHKLFQILGVNFTIAGGTPNINQKPKTEEFFQPTEKGNLKVARHCKNQT
uniref:Uncharacterized protein n=1 Tax=Odontella aurita TaxID=265563 RepID=A0A7S4JXZ1_9STRA|mmetsp:Transcript_56914/g.169838  ORF Transcript_56914/g.169838 Transcript_56914/m.169838 type:complete len:104 (+) Transcript_56914:68-379(+)